LGPPRLLQLLPTLPPSELAWEEKVQLALPLPWKQEQKGRLLPPPVEKARRSAKVLPQSLKLPRKEALPGQAKSVAARLLVGQTERRLRRPQRRLPAAGSQRAT
jgi:hypothetical protein